MAPELMQAWLDKLWSRIPLLKPPVGSKSGSNSWATARSLMFFVLFYLYLWLIVDLRLIYGGGGVLSGFPVFFKGWTFLREHLSYPGGLVEYLSAFLAQLFYIGWAGALIVTVQAWLICLCVGCFLNAMDLAMMRWTRFVPAMVLLIVYSSYAYHFGTTMALVVALLLSCFYVKLSGTTGWAGGVPSVGSQRAKLLGPIAFLVLSVVVYTVAGGAYLLFAVLCATYELVFTRRWAAGVLYLLAAPVTAYLVGVSVMGASTPDAFGRLLPFSWRTLSSSTRRTAVEAMSVLYLFLPVIGLVFGLGRTLVRRNLFARVRGQAKEHKTKQKRARKHSKAIRSRLSRFAVAQATRWVIGSLVLFGISGIAVYFSYDREKKALLSVQYYTCRRMWPQVLAAASQNPGSPFVINAVDRALYRTGRLGYDMLAHGQDPDALLLTGEDNVVAWWHKFDTQIDLGLMNAAEKNLTECMEVYGAQPGILKRLALVNMVKGDFGSARVFLGVLSRTLFHAAWAQEYLDRLISDPNLAGDDRIQYLRSVSLQKDDPGLLFAKDRLLLVLLEENGKNRMAFEYLLAHYMLKRRLDRLIENLRRLGDLDYAEIPRLYEEAAAIYVYGTRRPISLGGRQVSSETVRRIERFSEVFNRYDRNKQAAFSELAPDYGDSYFFYHIYGFSVVKR